MENIEYLMQRLKPASNEELQTWVRTLPKELGLRLLEEHFSLSPYPKQDPEVTWRAIHRKYYNPLRVYGIPQTPEEEDGWKEMIYEKEMELEVQAKNDLGRDREPSREDLGARMEVLRRERNLRQYLEELDRKEAEEKRE